MASDNNLLQKFALMQKALLSSLRLKDVLDQVVVQFAELSGQQKVAVFLADNERLALKLMAQKGYSEPSVELMRIIPFTAETLLTYVVQRRMPAALTDISQAPDISSAIMRKEESLGQIGVPLISSNLLIGALLIDVTDKVGFEQVEVLKECAEIAGMILANAILFGRSEYERERLDTLYKTSCELGSSALSVSEVLQIACDTALVLGHTPNCAILLTHPNKTGFSLAAFKGLDGESLSEFDLSTNNTVAGSALKQGKTQYIQDATVWSHGLPKAQGGRKFGSVLAIPIVHDGDTIGVLLIFSTDMRAFHREQLDLLESLVKQVGAALNIAMTHETTAAQTIQDAHTNLYNRWHFEEALAKEIERCERHKGRDLSVLLVDIDHLSHVNDHLGHDKGDDAIKHVAKTVKATVRDIDIPCRFGGEEFAVILPETAAENALEVAERIRQKIREEAAPAIGTVTVSIGVSSYPKNAQDKESVIRACEQAVDVAKYEGRDRVKLSECGMPLTGPIAWDELARQAKLAVISERKAYLDRRLNVVTEYANWMKAVAAASKKKSFDSK